MDTTRVFRFAALVLLLILAFQANAQQKGIRLYNSLSYRQYSPSSIAVVREFKAFKPSAGFFWSGKSRITHEVELTDLYHTTGRSEESINNTEVTSTSSILGAGLRYEAIIPMFSRDAESDVKAGLGLGLHTLVYGGKFQPGATNSFPSGFVTSVFRPCATPRVTWYVTERLGLDVSLPLTLAEWKLERVHAESPTVPQQQQVVSSSRFDLAPATFQLRLGAAIRL